MSEVLFFIGPPFSGSNLYFSKMLSTTYGWICPEELFHADPSLSLRSVILKVVNALKEGKNVVCDETISSKTRASYMNLIKAKVPDCSLKSLIFKVPAAQAKLQCRWAYEWELGRQFGSGSEQLLDPWQSAPSLDAKLDMWLSQQGADFPNALEGFDSISELVLPLLCNSPYELDLPALFLQWEGILDRADGGATYRPNVPDVITKWWEKNPTGRVIVVSDGTHTCDESGKGSPDTCTCLEDMKGVITHMASQLPVPLFFVRVDNPVLSGQFAQPPSVGLLAWLQRLHNISFTHKATFYIHSTEAHSRAAISAGIKGLRATKLHENSSMINAVYCGKAAQPPDCVRNACVASFGNTAHVDVKPSLPLLEQAMESANSGDGPFCVHMCKAGRVHGVCYRDKEVLQSYQVLFESSATPSKPAPTALFDSRLIWTAAHAERRGHRRELFENTSNTPSQSEARTRGLAPGPSSRARVSLREEQVAALAYSPGHFQRGLECKKTVQDFTTTNDADGIRIKCNCKGSFGRLYELSALHGQNGITMARCSCPDPAGKLGKCKHMVAMLMKYIDKDSSKACALGTPRRKAMPQSRSAAKRSKAADRTIYCMSPEELVTTAREIIKEKTTPITATENTLERVKCNVQQDEGCADRGQQKSFPDDSGLRKRRLVMLFPKDQLIKDEGLTPSSPGVVLKTEKEEKAKANVLATTQSISNPIDVVTESLVPEAVDTVQEAAETRTPKCSGHRSFTQSTTNSPSVLQPSSTVSGILEDQRWEESKKRPSVLDEFI